MPVISRPDTNQKRLMALQTAKTKADNTAPGDLAFSAATLTRLNASLPVYETELQQEGSALSAQVAASNTAISAKARLKMFISHFFQVFNFGVSRGVYTADQRAHFNLDVSSDDLPRLITEQEIANWGAQIVSGDAARVAAGGAAMANPSAAQVGAEHTLYVAAQADQSTKKDAYDEEQEEVAALNEDTDDLIADIWDEVAFTFRKDNPASRRRKMREYGVVFEQSPGENPDPAEFSFMGRVTDGNGNPINDAVVEIVQTGGVILTDNNGNYLIPLLPPGNYTLNYHKAGHVDQQRDNQTAAPGIITEINVILLAYGTVSGTVTDTGIPSANATITLNGTGLSANSGAGGNFSFPEVEPGSYTISAFLSTNPANIKTQNITVISGGSVVVSFSFP